MVNGTNVFTEKHSSIQIEIHAMTAECPQMDPRGFLNEGGKEVYHINLWGRNSLFNILIKWNPDY